MSFEFLSDDQGKMVAVRGTSADASAMVMVLTRLAAGIHTTATDAHVVFDKVGDAYTLSEIWTVGKDGYALSITKSAHEHKIVDTPR